MFQNQNQSFNSGYGGPAVRHLKLLFLFNLSFSYKTPATILLRQTISFRINVRLNP
ncbi:MAG: hypothetical protein MJ252_12620 [archaeon]|nr:hypothetical protein [archaeon]